MAQIREVRLVDDIDGSEAVETVQFGLRGKVLEIDLSAEHVKALEESFAEFAEHARPVAKNQAPAQLGSARKRRDNTGGNVRPDRQQSDAIRTWAREYGHSVADPRRKYHVVVHAYRPAHGAPPQEGVALLTNAARSAQALAAARAALG